MARSNWLDEATQTPVIDDQAREMSHFLDALADGRIDKNELKAQEDRLVALLKQVEPMLDDKTHELVTKLLCEVSAYSVMQVMQELDSFRGVSKLSL